MGELLVTPLPGDNGLPKSRREHIINTRSVNHAIIKFATGYFPVPPVIFPVWAEQIPGSDTTGI